MKEIARRFGVTGVYGNQTQTLELRLMERPLYRYADPEHDLIDGAVYAFAFGTNPEAILLVECRDKKGENPAWLFGFARMSTATLLARLGEQAVWSCPGIVEWNPAAPYCSMFGSHAVVFGVDAPELAD
jgi:hypothetical protein